MITNVHVLSRQDFINRCNDGSFTGKNTNGTRIAVISISDPDAEVPPETKEFIHVLPLKFSDCGPYPAWQFPQHEMKSLSFAMARTIVRFIERLHKDESHYTLVVHCNAGICRSGAVGLYTQMTCNLAALKFWETNRQIMPNEWVLNSLFQARMDLDEIEEKVCSTDS